MRVNFRAVIIIVISLLSLLACDASAAQGKKVGWGFIGPTFSPKGDAIIFGLCGYFQEDWSCDIATYNLATEGVSRFRPVRNATHGGPIYSRDGKMITFVAGKGDERHVYVMRSDGSNVRKLTGNSPPPAKQGRGSSLQFDSVPTFSPDGKRIIFKRAGVKRERTFGRGKMLSSWDIYEVDIAAGTERRLTNYEFYDASRPYYLADGRRFIFSGSGPFVEGDLHFSEKYRKKYEENKVFIMDEKNQELKPHIINGIWSSDPSVSADDTILFQSITNKMDGVKETFNYDLFIYKKGKTTRLTKMHAAIPEAAISPDGKRAVFIAIRDSERSGSTSLWVINTDGTGLTEIKLPKERLMELGKTLN